MCAFRFSSDFAYLLNVFVGVSSEVIIEDFVVVVVVVVLRIALNLDREVIGSLCLCVCLRAYCVDIC